MNRYLHAQVLKDLKRKAVVLTGPRQVGKTTLSRQIADAFSRPQYLNWDSANDRAVLERQSWGARSDLLIFDEIHKMPNWKQWLKGVVDTKKRTQCVLVTGSARMETFRQTGESLAGRYLPLRLHPISVREWVKHSGVSPNDALHHVIDRGGFPEPCLAENERDASRWRNQYATDLIREDVLEFSRLHEVNVMRTFFELLRSRVGVPLSLASMARDLGVASPTLKRYLDILQALYIVFTVQPFHRNVARSLLQAPKVYFFDTGLVNADEGVKFENAIAVMLLKHVHFVTDVLGERSALNYLRTKDGSEVDFCLVGTKGPTHLVECKIADSNVHRALARFSEQFAAAEAVQLVRDLKQPEQRGSIQIEDAAAWTNSLAA